MGRFRIKLDYPIQIYISIIYFYIKLNRKYVYIIKCVLIKSQKSDLTK